MTFLTQLECIESNTLFFLFATSTNKFDWEDETKPALLTQYTHTYKIDDLQLDIKAAA